MCSTCKKPPDKDTYACDHCKESYCQDCSKLSSTETRVLQLKNNRILKFICKKCQSPPIHELLDTKLKNIETTLLEEIRNLHKEVRFQDEKLNNQAVLINRLVNEISEMKESKGKETYANIAKKKHSEVLVVKPKEKQQSITTKSDLKRNIDPKSMAIAVENIREGKEGAVIINCNNTNTKEKIRETVEQELGTKYSVADGRQKNPKIIIRGVEEEFIEGSDETIIEAVREQNELDITNDSILTVYAKYKQREKINKGNIVLTVDVNLKNKICQLEKLNIGWRRCVAHEYFTVVRCFKCARYGHTVAKCENDVTCFNCTGLHKTTECTSKYLKCINCVETNNKLRKTLQTNHSVTDPCCPCYQRIINLEGRKTKQA